MGTKVEVRGVSGGEDGLACRVKSSTGAAGRMVVISGGGVTLSLASFFPLPFFPISKLC